MTKDGGSDIKITTILKWVGVLVLVIIAIATWNMPSQRGGGTVGDRAIAKTLAIGILMLPVVAVTYLLNRRKGKGKDDDPGNNLPTPHG